MAKTRRLAIHEVIIGATALLSCGLLLIIVPMVNIQDESRLISRAVGNVLAIARLQVITGLGVWLLTLVANRFVPVRRRLTVHGVGDTFWTVFRATLPLMLTVVFHQTIPIWQRIVKLGDADATLIWLDARLFGGISPVLWLQRLIVGPLTDYMSAVYLFWFVAFQGTVYLLALFRPENEWRDMMLATVITLVTGYVGYVLVPAVGPVHAMQSLFRVDLRGGAVLNVTNQIVDQFGVWRDAFPSIHAAITMVMMVYVRRYLSRWSAVYFLLGTSILVSTVYLRWHYVVDVLVGITIAMVASVISPRLLTRWDSAYLPHTVQLEESA